MGDNFVSPLATHGHAFEGQGADAPDADELDEATGPPPVAEKGLRWQDDPEHAAATTDVVARAWAVIDKLKMPSGRKAKLKQLAADMVAECKGAFRTKFYRGDKPAKVEPWLEPLIDGAAAVELKAHPRRYSATMSKLMAEMQVALCDAGILEHAGNITTASRPSRRRPPSWLPRSTSTACM